MTTMHSDHHPAGQTDVTDVRDAHKKKGAAPAM